MRKSKSLALGFLLGTLVAGGALGFIPFRLDDADLWVADLPHGCERIIGGMGDVDDNLVAQRQNGFNGRHKRIAEHEPVPDESEAADFHDSNSC